MANAWENVSWIASESLMHLEDQMIISQLAGRDLSAEFNNRPNGYQVGTSVDIRTNPVYQANEFSSSITVQDIRSSKRTLTIEKHFDVSVQLTAQEKRLNFEGFSEQVIMPAVSVIAEQCDIYVGTKILEAQGGYASDALFNDAADMALAKQAATLQQLDPTSRFCLMDDTTEAALLGKTYFNSYNNRGGTGELVFNEGNLGRAMGMWFFSSVNFPTTAHTAGSATATTNNTSGTKNLVGDTYLTFDAGSAAAINAGDRLAIAGVKRPVIAAETIADASADTEVLLQDPITDIIPDNAAITIIGSGQSLTHKAAIFDRSGIAIASPMLDPASDKPTSVVSHNGYSMRVVQGYDLTTKKETLSIDMIIGATIHDPRRVTLLSEY